MSRVARVGAALALVAGTAVATAGAAPALGAPAPGPSGPSGQAVDATTVVIEGSVFDPPTVTLTAGGTVTWLHRDGGALHSVTADGRRFDSHPACTRALPTVANCMSDGDAFHRTFDEPGSFTYHSKVHPDVRGTVVVVEPAAAPTTTTAPAETEGEWRGDAEATTTTTTSGEEAGAGGAAPRRPERSRDSEQPSVDVALPSEPDGGDPQAVDVGNDIDVAGASGALLFLLAAAGGGATLLWRYRPSQWDMQRDPEATLPHEIPPFRPPGQRP